MEECALHALVVNLDDRHSSYRTLDWRFLFPIRLSAAICLYMVRGIRSFIRASTDLQTTKSGRHAGHGGYHGSSGRHRCMAILCLFRSRRHPGVPSPACWGNCRGCRVCLVPQNVSQSIVVAPRSRNASKRGQGSRETRRERIPLTHHFKRVAPRNRKGGTSDDAQSLGEMEESTPLALDIHLDGRYSSYRGLAWRFLFPIRLSALIFLYMYSGIGRFINA